MANIFWISREEEKGGMCPGKDLAVFIVMYGAEITTMRSYVHWWRQGYDMDWTPPEWIQDIFPSRWDNEK